MEGNAHFFKLPRELRDMVYHYYVDHKILPIRTFKLRRMVRSIRQTRLLFSTGGSSGSQRIGPVWKWRAPGSLFGMPSYEVRKRSANAGHQLHEHALLFTNKVLSQEYLETLQCRCGLDVEVDDEYLATGSRLRSAWDDHSKDISKLLSNLERKD